MKNRQLFYTALPGIKAAELSNLFDNIAVTLGVHPYNFIIEDEKTRRVRIGGGVELKVCMINNTAEIKKIIGTNYIDTVMEKSSRNITPRSFPFIFTFPEWNARCCEIVRS